jgi:hypothetical protein
MTIEELLKELKENSMQTKRPISLQWPFIILSDAEKYVQKAYELGYKKGKAEGNAFNDGFNEECKKGEEINQRLPAERKLESPPWRDWVLIE